VLRSKRVIIGACGALTAALALTGCGLGGYNPGAAPAASVDNKPATDGDDGQPVGNVVTRISAKKLPRIGNVVTDSKGWIFYRFDEDSAKPPTSTCLEACADTWPPVLVKSAKSLPAVKGIDKKKLGTIKREDGGVQLTIGGWPMYRYAGDKKVGAWEGQGVGGTWFVATKDGKKNLRLIQAEDGNDGSSGDDTGDTGSGDDDSGDYGDGGGGGY
jgi:predicted lipoprotein with Yx(FWY)xxD motif